MKRWRAFMAATEGSTPLALFRMGMGASAILSILWVWVGGVVEPTWIDRQFGGMHRIRGVPWVEWLGGASPTIVYPLMGLGLMGGLLMIIGMGGRLSAFATLFALTTLTSLNTIDGAGYDSLLTNGLWLCVLGNTTATLSVDARWGKGVWHPNTPVGAWIRYLIVFQLCVMYTATGWQKLSSGWVPGGDFSALYYIVQMPHFRLGDNAWVADVFWLTQIGTAVTWSWESSSPLWFLSVRASDPNRSSSWGAWLVRFRVREIYVFIGLIMHVSLWFLMDVGPFGPITLAFYPALFHPSEWERWSQRFRR